MLVVEIFVIIWFFVLVRDVYWLVGIFEIFVYEILVDKLCSSVLLLFRLMWWVVFVIIEKWELFIGGNL